MKNINACLSSGSIHWATPKKLYDAFIRQGYIDPCPLHCKSDALLTSYSYERLFINPPFKDLSKWIDWIINQFHNGCDIALLMPVRTDTKYFNKLINSCSHDVYICFF